MMAGSQDHNTANMATSYTPHPSTVHVDAIAGSKRKRPTNTAKFYAVRIGKAPGIYSSWQECLDQVRGYPKAMFKSFTTASDAETYLIDGKTGAKGTSGPVTRWYGVQSGKKPGVYASWDDVLEQITGWKGTKHKAFKTRAEAEAYVAEGKIQTARLNGDDGPTAKKSKSSKSKKNSDTSGPMETGSYGPGEAPLPEDASDGFDPSIVLDAEMGTARYKTDTEFQAYKPMAVRPTAGSAIRIYTDGSSLGNGQLGATGGIGVFFGPADQRNLSEALPGTRQTNQRAELSAILRALEVAPRDRKCVIITDSQYAIKCCTEWFQRWRDNSWLNSSGKPVENRDLIQKVVDMLEERYKLNKHRVDDEGGADGGDGQECGRWEKGPASVKFEWVKGHDKDAGNIAADRLAVAGAREAQQLGGEVDLLSGET